MLVDDRHIKPDQIQDVMDKVQYVIEVTDGKVRFVGGPDENGESGMELGNFNRLLVLWDGLQKATLLVLLHLLVGGYTPKQELETAQGMDIGTPMNTNVYALDGEITKAGWDSAVGKYRNYPACRWDGYQIHAFEQFCHTFWKCKGRPADRKIW